LAADFIDIHAQYLCCSFKGFKAQFADMAFGKLLQDALFGEHGADLWLGANDVRLPPGILCVMDDVFQCTAGGEIDHRDIG
jgi:hypothetical protein